MIKNKKIEDMILETLETLGEVVVMIKRLFFKKDINICIKLIYDTIRCIEQIRLSVGPLEENIKRVTLSKDLISIKDLLFRMVTLIDNNNLFNNKLQYNLIPAMKATIINFYFDIYIYSDKKMVTKFLHNDLPSYLTNPYYEQAKIRGNYNYDLSVLIVGYNKLAYTKLCVEYFLKYAPEDISYELILVNSGSNDGTKEYFDQIAPSKQVDISVNGGMRALGFQIIEGEYCLFISNDVLIMPNAIKNMLDCMKSDKEIALIVPSTPNVSNLQSIPCDYRNFEGLVEFAKKNNIRNRYRDEQRVRVCNPIYMYRSNYYFDKEYSEISGTLELNTSGLFPDDEWSLMLRRRGLKIILQKDAYCYHFGSVTLKEDKNITSSRAYEEGRKKFYSSYGVDPWGTGFCFSMELIQNLEFDKKNKTFILGINNGFGSNPLKIKEELKERQKNEDVILNLYTNNLNYFEDIKGIGDKASTFVKWCEFENIENDISYDYIVIEDGLTQLNYYMTIISILYRKISERGFLCIYCKNKEKRKRISDEYSNIRENSLWIIIRKDEINGT